jgi:hypothetical protein
MTPPDSRGRPLRRRDRIITDLLLWPARMALRIGRIALGLFEPTLAQELRRDQKSTAHRGDTSTT